MWAFDSALDGMVRDEKEPYDPVAPSPERLEAADDHHAQLYNLVVNIKIRLRMFRGKEDKKLYNSITLTKITIPDDEETVDS